MDMTGYGRSTRPAPMNDPVQPRARRSRQFVPRSSPRRARRRYPGSADDDRLRLGRHRRRRRLHPRAAPRRQGAAWSPGRSAARAPAATRRSIREKVQRLVLLAPAYNRDGAAAAPAKCRRTASCSTRSRAPSSTPTGTARSAARGSTSRPRATVVWSAMLASDPVGATWGPGVRRAPQTTTWGWNTGHGREDADADADGGRRPRQAGRAGARAASSTTISARRRRCSIDLGCSSHNAMWEKNHTAALPRVARVAREGHR